MSNLTDLVPPLELCKLIPAGEFADSAFTWWQITPFEEWNVTVRSTWTTIPAPTLQEIMAKLPPYGKNEQILACCVPDWADFDARIFGENWRVGYTGDCSINDKNPATAALKLFLKLSEMSDK